MPDGLFEAQLRGLTPKINWMFFHYSETSILWMLGSIPSDVRIKEVAMYLYEFTDYPQVSRSMESSHAAQSLSLQLRTGLQDFKWKVQNT